MTALVSSNPTFFLNPANNPSHTPGILLNSCSQSFPTHSREPRQPSSFTSSSSSASQTSQSQSPSSNEGEGPCRRIRFAPLPAPRRDELPTVFYESDSDSQLAQSRSGSTTFHSNSHQPPSPHASSISTLQPDDTPFKSKSRTWGKKLLRPLLHPLLPSPAEESYSALFRISSRDSPKVNPDLSSVSYKGGVPLARRMSTGSRAVSSTKEAERSSIYQDGVPLMPVNSEGFASKGRKGGQRMLNGRVYGRRSSASQNGKLALYEPEFVEWGYGGMGSVVNDQAKSRSGPDWAKLQSKGKVLGGRADVDEEDDGSGMGWVKRRRAQREREEREREDREKSDPDHAVPDIAVHAPQAKESIDCSRLSSRSRRDSDQSRDNEEHHVYRAISIPALHHHHVRHHSHHKAGDGSGSATPTSAPPLSRANSSSSVPLIRTASTGSHGEVLTTMSERREDVEMSSGSSETGSTSVDEDEDENDTERESDDDDQHDAEGRITSRGAGVEKISRHKE